MKKGNLRKKVLTVCVAILLLIICSDDNFIYSKLSSNDNSTNIIKPLCDEDPKTKSN